MQRSVKLAGRQTFKEVLLLLLLLLLLSAAAFNGPAMRGRSVTQLAKRNKYRPLNWSNSQLTYSNKKKEKKNPYVRVSNGDGVNICSS